MKTFLFWTAVVVSTFFSSCLCQYGDTDDVEIRYDFFNETLGNFTDEFISHEWDENHKEDKDDTSQDWNNGHNEDDDDHQTEREKLTDEKLTILTNEIIRLKSKVEELSSSKKSKSKKSKFPTILSASRSVYPNKKLVTFSVTYKKQRHLKQRDWHKFDDYSYKLIKSNTTSYSTKSLVVVSVTLKIEEFDHVIFALSTAKAGVRIFLHNAGDEIDKANNNIIVNDIEQPVLATVPDDDFVYEKGRNLTITLIQPREETELTDPGSFLSHETTHISKELVILDTKNKNGINSTDWSVLSSVLEETKFLEEKETQIELNTAAITFSGLLMISSARNENSDLIMRIEREMIVIVRPFTQRGPFPRGKLYAAIRNSPPESRLVDKDLYLNEYCTVGEACHVDCSFFGIDIKRVKMFKIINGISHRVPSKDNSVDQTYLKQIWHLFTPKHNDIFPFNISCVAMNKNKVKRVINTQINRIDEVKIIEESSDAKSLGNGTVEAVCTAQGMPRPSVKIQCGFEDIDDNTVIVNQTNFTVTVKVLCPINALYFQDIRCFASNKFSNNYMVLNWK